jgi:hypothetical protein
LIGDRLHGGSKDLLPLVSKFNREVMHGPTHVTLHLVCRQRDAELSVPAFPN